MKMIGRISTRCSRAIIHLDLKNDGNELVYNFIAELISWLNRDARSTDPAYVVPRSLDHARICATERPPPYLRTLGT